MKAELDRVLSLPVIDVDHYANAWRTWTALLRTDEDGPALKPAQGAVLEHLHQLGAPYGVFGNMQIGSGKTMVGFMAPLVCESKRPLIMVPPGLDQALELEYAKWSQWYRLAKPRVVSYSDLSRADGAYLLDDYQPDLIIADEAHCLRHMTSARTKRFTRYVGTHLDTRCIFLSGTMTGGEVNHFMHLLYMALREQSPGPAKLADMERWGSVINHKAEATPEDYRAMRPLLQWSEMGDFELAYKKRVALSPGVVSTTGSAVAASLHIRCLTRPALPDASTAALQRLEDHWELPDGTLLTEPAHKASVARNMSVGFWYRPGPVPSPEWEDARREWSRQLRTLLEYRSRAGFDSPLLVENHIRGSDWSGYRDAKAALLEWDKYREIKRPDSEPVWMDKDWLLNLVAGWVKTNKRGLIWYYSRAVGGALADAGYDVRGPNDPAPSNEPLVCLSISRFKDGFNLQYQSKALVLEPPSGGTPWDQMLGREHRPGQTESVCYDVLQLTQAQVGALDKASKMAESMQRQSGNQHKLLLATREWPR